MSGHYLAGRATLLDAIVEQLAERLIGRRSVIVELGSGTGALLSRLANSLSSAELVGVEIDPVLRRLHQLGPGRRHGHRISLIDADLAEPAWTRTLRDAGPVDAVVAVQVLHYFPPVRFAALLDEIRPLLAPDGVFVHVDHVPPHDTRTEAGRRHSPVVEGPWDAWWADARQCSALADASTERDRWIAGRAVHSAEYHPDGSVFRESLERAGLSAVLFERRIGGSQLTIARPSKG